MVKKLKVIEAFAGIGSQTQALKNIGVDHEVVGIFEIDKFAIQSYETLHGKVNNLGDISKVNTSDIPDCDLFTYSFPCLTGESLILTDIGLKELKDVKVGDVVLTHTGEYKRVLNFFNQGVKEVYDVKGMGTVGLKATLNHKFLVRTKQYEYINKKRVRNFSKPYWKELKDINRNDYLGIPVNTVEELPIWDGYKVSWFANKYAKKERVFYSNKISNYLNNNDFWWMLGRYVADGWTRSQGGIVFGIGNSKLETFVKRIEKLYNIHIVKERTCFKVHIVDKELELFVDDFGKGAGNKIVPPFVKNLPIGLLEAFLEGYFSGDGCIDGDWIKCSSISEKLIYGLSECIYKVYKRPVSLYRNDRSETYMIENRVVNQKPSYCLSFKKNNGSQDKAFFEDGYIWFPFNKKTKLDEQEVFDIEVEDNHSFIANGMIVHNCTSISTSGKQKGFEKGSGTASSLLWECERIIKDKRPKYLLMENVKALVSKKFIDGFKEWLSVLDSLGYKTEYTVLNSKNYGVPQNRERVFAVSVLQDEPLDFLFPDGFELQNKLKDILENNVDEKFYIPQEKTEKLLIKLLGSEKLKQIEQEESNGNDILQVGNLRDTESFGGNPQTGRVYSVSGVSPTINTMG